MDSDTLAHLFKYDAIQVVASQDVKSDSKGLIIKEKHIKIIS